MDQRRHGLAARASHSQHPRILSFQGVQKGQSRGRAVCNLLFIWLLCNQEAWGRTNLIGFFSHPPACPSGTLDGERQIEGQATVSSVAGRAYLSDPTATSAFSPCVAALEAVLGTSQTSGKQKCCKFAGHKLITLALPVWLSHGELPAGLAPPTMGMFRTINHRTTLSGDRASLIPLEQGLVTTSRSMLSVPLSFSFTNALPHIA